MTKQTPARERIDWVATISLAHVHRGIEGGFIQADPVRTTRLTRLQAGDRIVFYSPRTDHPDGDRLQQFTACGTVVGEEAHQVELAPDLQPWRRDVRFEPCLPIPIRPLLGELGFIPDRAHWGIPFRRGLFPIPAEDFDRIASAMGAAGLISEDTALAASA